MVLFDYVGVFFFKYVDYLEGDVFDLDCFVDWVCCLKEFGDDCLFNYIDFFGGVDILLSEKIIVWFNLLIVNCEILFFDFLYFVWGKI